MKALGPYTITVDCDCLVADGGTRTASITGGFVALVDAIRSIGKADAVLDHVAAVSVGIIGERRHVSTSTTRRTPRATST